MVRLDPRAPLVLAIDLLGGLRSLMHGFQLLYVRIQRFISGVKLADLRVEIFHFNLLLLDFHRALTNVFFLFLD